MKTHVAHLPDRSARYLEAGRGQTVLLIHAFPLSADQFLPQLHRVPPGFRMIAPDLRGFRGAGPAFDAGIEARSIDDYGADILGLMDHLDIDRAILAGVSMGGYVALALAARSPGRLAGLVLANTRATPDSAEARSGRDRLIELVRRDGAAALVREMLPNLLGATTRREQPDLVEAVARLIEANVPEALTPALRALKERPDRTGMLPAIACPTIVVAGEEDAVIPRADVEAMRAAIPGARLVVLPRVGHLSNLEDHEGFAAIWQSFTPVAAGAQARSLG